MRLDIRVPIGILFTVNGLLLVLFGAFADPALFARSLGINIDCWWGGVMLLFGGFMLFLSRKSFTALRASAPGERPPP